jgi:hypothetical protein
VLVTAVVALVSGVLLVLLWLIVGTLAFLAGGGEIGLFGEPHVDPSVWWYQPLEVVMPIGCLVAWVASTGVAYRLAQQRWAPRPR